MEIPFKPEQQGQISSRIAAVREAIEQADRGEFVDDEDVRAWLEQQEQRI